MNKEWLKRIGSACLAFSLCRASLVLWATLLQGLGVQALAASEVIATTTSPLLAALPDALRPAWRRTQLPDTALSLVVREIGGAQRLAFAADTPRNPASVMKLVTTWLALTELGPQHVWRTALLTDPGARLDDNGALTTPLYLRASGDPMLQIRDVWALLHALRLRGVRRLGDVVVDRSLFGSVAIDPGQFDGAADRPYNASPDALVMGLGAVQLTFIPDPVAKRWRVIADPPLPGVALTSEVQWRDGRCLGTPVVATEVLADEMTSNGTIAAATDVTAEAALTAHGVTLRLQGQVAGACGEFSLYRLVLTQPRFATAVLRYLWQQMGGEVSGQVRPGKVPMDAVLWVEHTSPTVSELIRAVNKSSNNLMARMLLLSLATQQQSKEGVQAPVTLPESRATARAALAAQGLHMPELVLDNGSGLSRASRISAASLARLLTIAWQSPRMPEYLASLAIVGVDGTLNRRLRHHPARGMAHLKTGSLRDVRALAGYVQGASGKRYIVVSLVNHGQAYMAQPFEDALIAWLARQ